PIAASILAIGMASMSPSSCFAGNDSVDFGDAVHIGDRTPTKDEIIDLLQPKPALKMRSIRLRPAGLAVADQTRPAAISMQITFSFNSDELSPRALEQLKPVAEALASRELSGLSFLVEGHTDSVGSEPYNQRLSERRAGSVRRLLTSRYPIDPARIDAVGKGESMLLDPKHPASGVNRRVRIATE
ncbi:MAG: OmpA family protein, partial [Gammaproteobacteria bacterium]